LGGVEIDGRRGGRKKPAASAARLWLALGLAATMIAAAASSKSRHQPITAQEVARPASSTAFRTRDDLPPLLFVRALDGGRAVATYETRVRDSDGERRDALVLGDPTADGPFVLVSARLAGASPRPSIFFVELVRQAAELGQAVVSASDPAADAESDGAMLVSDVQLDGSGRRRACLGFRLNVAGPVALSGIACGAPGEPIDRGSLTCLASRLQATPAGVAAGLDKVLRQVAGERPAC
jgi:hypothetical protein